MNDLDELVEYREVISGNKFCKDELLQILKNVDVRYELWKYYEACGEKIEHWLQTPFFKTNIKKVLEKMSEWQLAAENLKSLLPDHDEVYEAWIRKMEAFTKDFPLLQLLSSDALKEKLTYRTWSTY
ncbi:uncharacterized protein LOC124459187 isoform X2 [Xenia sp. Carnegie-2017]|uniref:uncharacterized protein LOC124459187 isoform X2 n=1 Tax=Xenia sp. Carnegie-2017 TaxID=2897299 RepID=UPI001F04B8D4|nr:uncharacterized protein LOC124459187 isoform X2 [Xenia sp. Carnegie-2017]